MAAALQSYINFGAADHVSLLHHAHKSSFAIASIVDGNWYERTYPKPAGIQKASDFQAFGIADCYVQQNATAYGKKRCTSNISCLANCYVDLDTYNVPELAALDKHAILQKILDTFPDMPRPTMFADSGRGMYLVWTFTTTKPHSFLPHWQVIEDNLVELLKPFGADPHCRDVTRVLRISGTENSKALKAAGYEQIGEPLRYENLQKYSNKLTKERKQYTTPKQAIVTQLRKDFTKSTTKNVYTLAYQRMQDIKTLAKLRGGKLTDLRKTALYAYGISAAWYCTTTDSLLAELKGFIYDYLDAPESYVKRLPTTVISRYKQSLDDATITWNGKEYDARYRITNAKLISLLQITASEQQHLSTIIGKAEKASRKNASQTERRRKLGVVARDQYEQAAQAKRLEALNLFNKGLNKSAIAKALGISRASVIGYLAGAR